MKPLVNFNTKAPKVMIIGSTGAVGTELLEVLEKRNFPLSELVLFSSPSSAGKKQVFQGKEHIVQEAKKSSLEQEEAGLAFMCTSSEISLELSPVLQEKGSIVIDNSSAFRMHSNTPLIVPEINAEDIKKHKGIIANPNCSTIILLMAVFPIYNLSPIQKIIVSTYQAVSGAGKVGIEELEQQTRAYLNKEELKSRIFPHTIAFNAFSHDSAVDDKNLHNGEEIKMMKEVQKILHNESILLSATCIRIPTFRAHSESIHLELAEPLSLEEIHSAYANFPGVQLLDEVKLNLFPMPITTSQKDDVYVGRLRHSFPFSQSLLQNNKKEIDLWCCGDQLLKGASLNAVQIAELFLSA